MMLFWHSEAETEFLAAAEYYDEQDDQLGMRFAAQIQATVARIVANPSMPRSFDGNCRKVKAEKFPYVVIYFVDDELIQILAVMHTSRRPRYWKKRLKGE